VLTGVATIAAAATPGYHVVKQIPIGGIGGWDYLTIDSATHYLYVGRSTHTIAIDVDKGIITGDIANTPGVHGVALVSKLNAGFISNGRDNTVTIFDMKTFKEKQRVNVGQGPDAIVYDPSSNRVFTMNGDSHDTTAIDAKTGNVVGTIALGGKPEAAVPGGNGTMFVNIEDKNEIVEFDSHKLTVKNRWSIAPVEGPTGLAFDSKNHRLFSVGDEMMAVVDSNTGKLIQTVHIGKGADGAEFDTSEMLAFSSNGRDGTLTVVKEESANKFTVVETVPTKMGARTMALDPKNHNIYLATADFVPTASNAPRTRPTMKPDSFVILAVGK